MDESLVGIMEILGPVILLIELVWLVGRHRSGENTRAYNPAVSRRRA